jgi:hypothetical protein
VLRHDKTLQHTRRIQPELKHIPTYLMPQGIEKSAVAAPKAKAKRPYGHSQRHPKRKKDDPLKSFSFKQRKEAQSAKK